MSRKRPLLVAAFVAAAVALSACGSSSKSTSSSSNVSASKNSQIAAEVPSSVKSKGSLTVAADATYAPNEFIQPGSTSVVGMDVDLGHALGDVMGIKFNFVNATFDSIIPGLAAHKFDLGMSSFTDTKEREKTVDFVTYFSAGTSFYTKATGGPTINTIADICGRKVAVEKGTTQQTDAAAQAKKCTNSSTSVLVFPDQNGVNLALSSGRADVAMADSPVAAYAAKQSNGQFKVVGKTYGTAPYGIAIPKGTGLDKPLLDAVKLLMSNGKYMSILQHWGIQSGAINNPTINGATS